MTAGPEACRTAYAAIATRFAYRGGHHTRKHTLHASSALQNAVDHSVGPLTSHGSDLIRTTSSISRLLQGQQLDQTAALLIQLRIASVQTGRTRPEYQGRDIPEPV